MLSGLRLDHGRLSRYECTGMVLPNEAGQKSASRGV